MQQAVDIRRQALENLKAACGKAHDNIKTAQERQKNIVETVMATVSAPLCS